MENAFKPGDPLLELAALGGQKSNDILEEDEDHWIRRPEQAKIDAIINGTDRGHYYLMVGEKGTGKSSMLLNAMQNVDGEGVSVSNNPRYLSLDILLDTILCEIYHKISFLNLEHIC